MQRPLEITFRGVDQSDAIEEHVRTKAAALERFYDHITGVRVTVEAPHKRHRKGNLYEVRVEITLPDKQIVVGRSHRRDHAHEDAYVAVRDSFDAAVRQLEDYARKRRGQVKRHS